MTHTETGKLCMILKSFISMDYFIKTSHLLKFKFILKHITYHF